jgi:hypothetical protein
MARGRSRRRSMAGFTPPLFSDGGDPALIHACVKKVNGQVRIVGPDDSCLPSESSLHWAAGPSANTAGTIMVHGTTFGAGGTPINFVHLGGGIPVYRTPRDGVIQNMRVLVRSNTYDGASPMTLLVNGAPTALATVIPAGSTADIDVPGTVAISDGDQVSIILDRGASTTGTLEVIVSYEIL